MDVPVISFDGYRIKNLSYSTYLEDKFKQKSLDLEKKAGIKVSAGMTSKETNGRVEITTQFSNENRFVIGEISMYGYFSFKEGLSSEEKQQYLATNGSAMLYPYIRTIVSMITALDDSEVSVLPTLNFRDMFNSQEKN